MYMHCSTVLCMDSIEVVYIDTGFHVVVVVTAAHDATQYRKVCTIPVNILMSLLITVCCCWTGPPYVSRNKAFWEIECWECKFISFNLIFQPSWYLNISNCLC